MAFSRILASTLGLLVLISLTSGQTDINKPIPACNSNDVAAGIYTLPHPSYPQVFIRCSNNNQVMQSCADGTLYDPRINQCNHVYQAVNPAAACSPSSNTVGKTYPGTCCEKYYRCNGEILVAMTCPADYVYNAQSGQCGQGICVDHTTCSRPKAPSGTQWTCPIVPDSTNPCNYQYNVNGTLSQSQPCPEGTRADVNACTCITDPKYPCMRNADTSGSKTLDSQCRANWVTTFDKFQPGTNNPQAVSEKTGATLPDTVLGVKISYTPSEAHFNSDPQTNAPSSLYIYAFSNRELTNNVIIEIVFRSEQPGTYEILSNNRDGACAATISINGTYNGNGAYQISAFVTGATQTALNQQITSIAQFSVSINVGATDYILVRLIFNAGRAQLQVGNRGPSGTGTGQIVNGQESGVIGEKLAYNKCGFQVLRGLAGIAKRIAFREGCLNTELYRT